MQNLLLLHPKLLFYKIRIYNKLSRYLRARGYNLIVWPTRIDAPGERVEFNCIDASMTRANLRHVLGRQNIDVVVNHLCRRSVSVRFYVAAALVARGSGRRFIYYGHGLNLPRRDNAMEILLSNLYLTLCHQVILFSPREKRYLWRRNRRKVAVAWNTLDMDDAASPDGYSRAELAKRYGITESHVVLFSGRIQPRKRLGLLLDCFVERRRQLSDVGLVIVGPDLPQRLEQIVRTSSNIHYLGPVYEKEQMAELFRSADVFCIPGSMGLGIVEALYWARPIITLNVKHGPEACYLKNGRNCVVVDDEERFADELISLLRNEDRRKAMGAEARRTFEKEASLDNMFGGFYEGLRRADKARAVPTPIADSLERSGI